MWKTRVNRALRAATGYELQRAGSRRSAPAAATATPAAETARHRPRKPPPARRKPAQRRPKAASGLALYDDAARLIIGKVKPRTMTGHEKLFALILATRYIAEHRIPGDIVECGVWRGGSMQAAAMTLSALGDTGRDLHLFDTFEGMTEPTEKDRRHDGQHAADLLATSDRSTSVWAVASLEDVQAGMAELDYPQQRIHFHKGRVEETVPAEAPQTIAILRLDTDWYESTAHELEHLYDRLSPGGVLIIDDFGWWEGSRIATEEFLKRTGARLLLLPIASGRIAVKPLTS